MTRVVKLGRMRLSMGISHHWAVQVGNTWYEIEGATKNDKNSRNAVRRSHGYAAASGAGSLGGEIAGTTDKSDREIYEFIDQWLAAHPNYDVVQDNCQTFSLEFIIWLTDGNHRVSHMLDAGEVQYQTSGGTFTAATGGIAIARASTEEQRTSWGPFQFRAAGPSAEASAIANTPIHAGVFTDAELGRLEVSTAVGGVHFSPNVNTGIGTRDGNLDVHFLGFGVRAGADGLGIDTPLGGATACSVM